MNRLKIVKNFELKKNKSMNNVANKQMGSLKFQGFKKKKFCKIYRYYSSKDKIAEKLMFQGVRKMARELKEKQDQETKEYNDIFHKDYPPENETEYENEIKNIFQKEKTEIENYEAMKKNYFKKRHDEYMNQMGIEFEKGFDKLSQKFKKETEEQNFVIRKIILNHQLKEIEKNNMKDNNKERESHYTKDIDKNRFIFTKFQFYLNPDDRDKTNKNKDKIVVNKLCSKIFRFKDRGKVYKTIIV